MAVDCSRPLSGSWMRERGEGVNPNSYFAHLFRAKGGQFPLSLADQLVINLGIVSYHLLRHETDKTLVLDVSEATPQYESIFQTVGPGWVYCIQCVGDIRRVTTEIS